MKFIFIAYFLGLLEITVLATKEKPELTPNEPTVTQHVNGREIPEFIDNEPSRPELIITNEHPRSELITKENSFLDFTRNEPTRPELIKQRSPTPQTMTNELSRLDSGPHPPRTQLITNESTGKEMITNAPTGTEMITNGPTILKSIKKRNL